MDTAADTSTATATRSSCPAPHPLGSRVSSSPIIAATLIRAPAAAATRCIVRCIASSTIGVVVRGVVPVVGIAPTPSVVLLLTAGKEGPAAARLTHAQHWLVLWFETTLRPRVRVVAVAEEVACIARVLCVVALGHSEPHQVERRSIGYADFLE